MVIHVTNLDLIRGMEPPLIFDGSGNLLTIYSELSNVMLYFVFIIIMTIPPLISRYLPRLTIIWPMSRDISQIIMNLVPQLITVSLLYIPLINDLWNYYITPLLVVGSLIVGFSTYALDIAQSRLKVVTQSVLRTRRRSPIVIPIIDPLMITEYGYWIKKLPKDDVDLVNAVVNILSKTGGVAALHVSLPQDKVEIIAKALFGLTRAKGFIIKGDINELTNDVNWFIKTHEKALLVLIPNEINKDMILRLIDYNKRMKLYALIINNGSNDVISKLRKYGIEVITYGEMKNTEINQKQTKNVEEIQLKQGNMTETVINTNVPNNSPTPINEEPIQASNVPINMGITTTPAKVVNEESVNRNNEVATNLQLEKGITKEEKALEVLSPRYVRKRRKARRRGRSPGLGVRVSMPML